MTTRRRRQQRPAPRPALNTEQIRQLARDLISDLAPAAGDADAVRKVLLRWLGNEDTGGLSMIAMSGMQIMFAECLTRTPIGAWTLNPPPERNTP